MRLPVKLYVIRKKRSMKTCKKRKAYLQLTECDNYCCSALKEPENRQILHFVHIFFILINNPVNRFVNNVKQKYYISHRVKILYNSAPPPPNYSARGFLKKAGKKSN